MRSDDPIKDFLNHDAELEEELEKLPVCDYCGDPIQDTYLWKIGSDTICDCCARINFRFRNQPAPCY